MATTFDDSPEQPPARRFASFAGWVSAALGASLWLQLLFGGLGIEAQTGQMGLRVVVFFLPLPVLAFGLIGRRPSMALLLFPVMLVPGVAILSPAERAVFASPWTMGGVAATLAVYLAVTSAWLTGGRPAGQLRGQVSRTQQRARQYQRYALSRAVPMLLMFAVPLYAVYFDRAIVGTIAQNFPGNEAAAQAFIALTVFFACCVSGYVFFVVPMLNLEYDRRRLERALEPKSSSTERRRVWYRLGAWTVGTSAVIIVLLLLV